MNRSDLTSRELAILNKLAEIITNPFSNQTHTLKKFVKHLKKIIIEWRLTDHFEKVVIVFENENFQISDENKDAIFNEILA